MDKINFLESTQIQSLYIEYVIEVGDLVFQEGANLLNEKIYELNNQPNFVRSQAVVNQNVEYMIRDLCAQHWQMGNNPQEAADCIKRLLRQQISKAQDDTNRT